jgi:HK97 family phage prohead protease
MPALPVHYTATTDAPWDGPAAVAAAPNDPDVLRWMHAWRDPDADPETKVAWKFPHHAPRVGSPANLAAVRNALARLPQADIPDADRPGVEAHLRAHLEDAQRHDTALERRATGRLLPEGRDVAEPRISGYAIVWDLPYAVGVGPMAFRERVARGAVDDVLAQGAPVALLRAHDGLALASTRAGTMTLTADAVGLRVDAELDPANPASAEVLSAVRRGDTDGMSIGFRARRDVWDESGDVPLRTIEAMELLEVSVVQFPAQPATVVVARGEGRTGRSPVSARLARALAWRARQHR